MNYTKEESIKILDDFNVENMLDEFNIDLSKIKEELSSSTDELENSLKKISKDLKHNLENFAKELKTEAKADLLKFYHDNNEIVDKDLSILNSFIKDSLNTLNDRLDSSIAYVDDDKKEALKAMKEKLIKFSWKYNFKYTMLKLRLALAKAKIDIKNFF